MNCKGCKWLDQLKNAASGEGYCCMVEQSEGYRIGDKARYSNSERCELYSEGDFTKRYKEEHE